MQGVVIAMLTTGGVVGKGAYEEIREDLTLARIEAAQTQQAIADLDSRLTTHASRPHVAAEHALEDQRERLEQLAQRVAVLEHHAEH